MSVTLKRVTNPLHPLNPALKPVIRKEVNPVIRWMVPNGSDQSRSREIIQMDGAEWRCQMAVIRVDHER